MNLREPISVGLSQLRANKMRSLLTILGILIGVGSVVGIVSIGEGLRSTVLSEFDKMGGSSMIWVMPPREWVRKDGRWVRRTWREYLTEKDVEAMLEETDKIKNVLPNAEGGAEVRYKKASTQGRFTGTTPNFTDAFSWETALGRFLSQKDLDKWRRVCVIGKKIWEDLFGEKDPTGQEIKIKGERYTVIGVMEEKKQFGRDLGDQVMIPISTVQRRITGNDRLSGATVYAKDVDYVDEVASAVRRVLKRNHEHGDEFQVETSENALKDFEKVVLIMKMIAGGIAGISLLVGGIGIMNIMLVSVAERTREIGIRKAVGAKKRHIMSQFIVESVVLSLFGGAIGITFGLGLGLGISNVITHYAKQPFPSVVSLSAVLFAIGYSAAIGIFFGVYPAMRAARLDPVEALRYE